ncbi:MAG: geranylgeranylglycerol-phosphate geranylgeranyltransferase [Flavicella sp.]
MRLLINLSIALNLIRWKNLIFLALAQSIFYFFVLFPSLKFWQIHPSFNYLLIATISIAAAGYIINDCYDTICDRINKPHKAYIDTKISRKSALYLYYLLNCIGIFAGIKLCMLLGENMYSFFFLSIVIALYAYSKHLKKTPIIGNLLVSLLVTSNTLILYFFPFGNHGKDAVYVLQFAFFAFFINLLREMVKDLEDMNGDYNAGMYTLPIILGKTRSIKIILSISSLVSILFMQFCIVQLDEKPYFQVGFLSGIIFPLFYFMFKIYLSKTQKHFHKMSLLLKGILMVGLLFISILCLIN